MGDHQPHTADQAAIYLYTLVPDKLLGWNYELNDIEKSIILEKYLSIPNFGMGDAINYEAVIAVGPTIAFNVSAINEGTMDESDKLAAYAEDTFNDIASLDIPDEEKVQVYYGNGEPKANMSGGTAADAILNDPDFSSLTDAQNGTVYGTPNAPFSWVDRPPGPNRIIGMRWLFGLIYPEYVDYDVDEEVREFFKLFYHVGLTDEQLELLYNGTL